jgi:hypothetical protein
VPPTQLSIAFGKYTYRLMRNSQFFWLGCLLYEVLTSHTFSYSRNRRGNSVHQRWHRTTKQKECRKHWSSPIYETAGTKKALCVRRVQQLARAKKCVATYTVLLSYMAQRNDLHAVMWVSVGWKLLLDTSTFALMFIRSRSLFIYGTTYRFPSVFKHTSI